MSAKKQSQPAARRRGGLHRAHGDRQVGQAITARRHLARRRLPVPRQAGHVLN
jgi:hypothetical protein